MGTASFGKSVAELVEGVPKLISPFRDKKRGAGRKLSQNDYGDGRISASIIKLADRTLTTRTLASLRPDKRRRIARETLEICQSFWRTV